MSDREGFLSNVRSRLGRGAPPNLPHPLPALGEVARLAPAHDLTDPLSAFEAAATRVSATVRRTDDPAEMMAEVVAAHGVRTAALSGDPECDGLAEPLQAAGIEVVGDDPRTDLARADLGITGAAWGVAATGSVIVDASRAGGRCVSLLPEVHLALVRADRIVEQTGDIFRELGQRFPTGLPSQFVFITGPSRSGDIELQITMGVHGPRTVWIGIVG